MITAHCEPPVILNDSNPTVSARILETCCSISVQRPGGQVAGNLTIGQNCGCPGVVANDEIVPDVTPAREVPGSTVQHCLSGVVIALDVVVDVKRSVWSIETKHFHHVIVLGRIDRNLAPSHKVVGDVCEAAHDEIRHVVEVTMIDLRAVINGLTAPKSVRKASEGAMCDLISRSAAGAFAIDDVQAIRARSAGEVAVAKELHVGQDNSRTVVHIHPADVRGPTTN